jgi:deoxyhypusine synthase
MNEHFLQIIVTAAGLVSGLIGTYVSLLNRALLAEVRQELAELEVRIFNRINGTYVRSQEAAVREQAMKERIERLAGRLEERNAASPAGQRREGEKA